MEKQLSWARKLGRVESLWISKVGYTVLARSMESQILYQPTGSVQGGLSKGTMASACPDTRLSVSPCVPLVPVNLPPPCWSSEGVNLSR